VSLQQGEPCKHSGKREKKKRRKRVVEVKGKEMIFNCPNLRSRALPRRDGRLVIAPGGNIKGIR